MSVIWKYSSVQTFWGIGLNREVLCFRLKHQYLFCVCNSVEYKRTSKRKINSDVWLNLIWFCLKTRFVKLSNFSNRLKPTEKFYKEYTEVQTQDLPLVIHEFRKFFNEKRRRVRRLSVVYVPSTFRKTDESSLLYGLFQVTVILSLSNPLFTSYVT